MFCQLHTKNKKQKKKTNNEKKDDEDPQTKLLKYIYIYI